MKSVDPISDNSGQVCRLEGVFDRQPAGTQVLMGRSHLRPPPPVRWLLNTYIVRLKEVHCVDYVSSQVFCFCNTMIKQLVSKLA